MYNYITFFSKIKLKFKKNVLYYIDIWKSGEMTVRAPVPDVQIMEIMP